MVPEAEFTSYYGRPVIKEPVWRIPDVPRTSSSADWPALSVLTAGHCDLTGGRGWPGWPSWPRSARRLSVAALIHDLGRPTRFRNMLRVIKPTSPMRVGSWLLAAIGPVRARRGVRGDRDRCPGSDRRQVRRWPGRPGDRHLHRGADRRHRRAGLARRLPRPAVRVRRHGASAAGGGMGLLATAPRDAEPARNLAVFGAAVELAAKRRLIKRLACTPRAEPGASPRDRDGRRGAAARRVPDRGPPRRRGARTAQPGRPRPVRRLAAGRLGA